MNESRYDVYFAGEIIQEKDPEQVKIAIGEMFGITGKKLEHLFSGARIRVKVEVDEETAIQYRIAFRDAGALVTIKPSEGAVNKSQTPAQTPHSPTQESHTSDLELLPANTGDLSDCIRPMPSFETPDLSWLSIAPPGSQIDENSPPEPLEIDTHELSLAPANSGSLEDIQIKKAPVPIPDSSHLHLDEA